MKFAFIILGNFNSENDQASIHNGSAKIIGVSSIDEACRSAIALKNEGVSCIELCGAFMEEGARKVIEATDNEVAVGYVVHLPEQDEIFSELFS